MIHLSLLLVVVRALGFLSPELQLRPLPLFALPLLDGSALNHSVT